MSRILLATTLAAGWMFAQTLPAQALRAAEAQYRVVATLHENGVARGTTTEIVAANDAASLEFSQVRDVRVAGADATVTYESMKLYLPGNGAREALTVGHDIKVRVLPAKPRGLRLDVDWTYREPVAGEKESLRVTGTSVREVVTIHNDQPAHIVLARDAGGAPQTWMGITVTSANDEAKIYAVTYNVADMLQPAAEGQGNFAPLIELIETTVAPATWQALGGPASITPFPNNLSLVVTTSAEAHEELAALLKQLRAVVGRSQE